MPAIRLMTMACSVSRTTALMRSKSCQGLLKSPRETISAVEQAGGCDVRSRIMAPAVIPNEKATAMTRGHVTPTKRAGPAIVNPVTTRLR